jgi:hypothetical protein
VSELPGIGGSWGSRVSELRDRRIVGIAGV